MVPKLTDRGVVKISLQTVCYGTWMATDADGNNLQLLQIDDNHIGLKINHRLTNIIFEIYEQVIRNLKLQRGGYCPADRRYVYYVVDETGRRFRHLYLYQRRFGTRLQLGLRYPTQCMSRSARNAYKLRYDRRRVRRRRARERQQARQIAAFKARMGMT